MEAEKRKLYIDWYLITVIAILTAFGLVMVYSASFVEGYQDHDNMRYFFNRQLQFLLIGSVMFTFLMFFPYRHYQKLIIPILFLCFALLIAVLIPGVGNTVNGATRWIQIGPFGLQASEFVKLGAIIYLSYIYSRKQAYINSFLGGFMPPLIIVGGFFFLIMMQPDLGTGMSIVLVAILIAFFSGARYLHLFAIGSVAAGVMYWYANSEQYRLDRLIGFRTPFELEQTQGFQLVQSYIAIAHGGLTGAGLGNSVQKLFYLPEAHTDFILAIVSEELGFLGIVFLFSAILFLIGRGVLIGARCKDAFGSLLAFGIVFQLSIQIILNAGAVSGMLPITGIPFPFVSYGGSSLLVTMMSMGVLANVSRRTEKDRQEKRGIPEQAKEEPAVSASARTSYSYSK
ncbi:putative lipid II flippase FtsW [Paenalkalicoccus suaedae]|uniref:Probable peptidoglycan glycosyltransferase FtsW n=1 Tax=Paenalkalicoccus suaedae TaxID=2592382 RepID=A0A859FIP0_9BACI|nr:putative lipid II flippase FtsW [Paenalkalicoccus suaedae]QKS72115.1 putative lipid II flippase FtsW [Paenalkalicoccus suaedae]